MPRATPAQPNCEILFPFQEMILELRHLKGVATGLLDPGSPAILDDLADQLANYRDAHPRDPVSWQISAQTPVRTAISKGKYEAGERHGEHEVRGQLSGCWEIQVPPPHVAKERGMFRLVGLASMQVSIRDDQNDVVQEWHFDVGDAASPGCHFHAQIGNDSPLLPVPRFPSLVITPADALDFLLDELFQTEWEQRAGEDTTDARGWRKLQQQRLRKLLRWQDDELRASSEPVAWTHLKRRKPPADVFVRKLVG